MMAWAKYIVASFLALIILLASSSAGLCGESEARMTYYRYIRALYYATKLEQVAPYWIRSSRIPFLEMKGSQAATQLARLKAGYVSNPRIITEVKQGNVVKMQGTGIVIDNGQKVNATVDVIMFYEDGVWRVQYTSWRGQVVRPLGT